ncbi:MAG: GNAT family N-acetyltransferase [Clostridiales bacterium]|nr:GNAT family N-acetyltransferase [Clostridiales bacterium]
MVNLQLMKKEEIVKVLDWNMNTVEFLEQWSNFTYPLTKEQYEERMESKDFVVYSIYDDTTMIGTIQMFQMDSERKYTKVGCFLINPELRGKGYGEQAMNAVLHKIFTEKPEGLGYKTVALNVWDYNNGAQRCYEKCGFKKVSEQLRPNGLVCYGMEKTI